MSDQKLESRVKLLEKQMEEMRNLLLKPNEQNKPWWEQITGSFADSEGFDSAMELGKEYRQSQQNNFEEE